MGSTFEADIPGNVEEFIIENASAASNAGAARYGAKFAEQTIHISKVRWVPIDGDQAGASANFRTVFLVDGGTSGTATQIVAAYAFSATNVSAAQYASVNLTIDEENADIAPGEMLYFSHTGSGVVQRAGFLQVNYRLD